MSPIAPDLREHDGSSAGSSSGEPFAAATLLLVSQFLLDRGARIGVFRGIADRLRPGASLVNADLSSDAGPAAYESPRGAWFRMMRDGVLTPEAVEKMRPAHDRDVAILPPDEVGEIIAAGGFDTPVRFLQTGLIRAWYARRV